MSLAGAVNHVARRVPAWTIYVAGTTPPVWLLWAGASGRRGGEELRAIDWAEPLTNSG